MAQLTLLQQSTSTETIGLGVYFSPYQSITIQFNPNRVVGFRGLVIMEFLVATMLFLPWLPLMKVTFGGNQISPVVVNLPLGPNYLAVRPRIAEATLGSIAIYMAY